MTIHRSKLGYVESPSGVKVNGNKNIRRFSCLSFQRLWLWIGWPRLGSSLVPGSSGVHELQSGSNRCHVRSLTATSMSAKNSAGDRKSAVATGSVPARDAVTKPVLSVASWANMVPLPLPGPKGRLT